MVRPSTFRNLSNLVIVAILLAAYAAASAAPRGKPIVSVPFSTTDLHRASVQRLHVPATLGNDVALTVGLDGANRRVRLQAHSLRAGGFQILVQGRDGRLRTVSAPSSRTYRGTVEGLSQSRVAAAVRDGQLTARIQDGGDSLWQVEPRSKIDGKGAPDEHVVYRATDLAPVTMPCGTVEAAGKQLFKQFSERGLIATATAAPTVADVAFDADYEFFLKNGGSVAATVHDIENIMNQVALIYESELNITFEITTIIVRAAEPDPYTATDHETLLQQFKNEWNLNFQGIHRDIAHLMTGKDVNNNVIGAAFTDTMCSVCGPANGYAFSESRFTTFMPQRVCLTAHEIGHNFGASHCNEDSDCFIMCSLIGSCAGDCTRFGRRSQTSILDGANGATCLSTLPPAMELPFCDSFDGGGSADPLKWSYNAAATVSTLASKPPSPPQSLLLDNCCTPCAAAPDDIRSTAIRLGSAAGATLSYHTQHAGGPATAGSQLHVDYLNVLGQWAPLNTITADGISQPVFTFWSHELPLDAMHNEFRFRFRLGGSNQPANWFLDDVSLTDVTPDTPILFVRSDAPLGGDGTSWESAFRDLQDAITVAACSGGVVEEIWVAAGTYRPDGGTGDRNASFELVNGVGIYGGFSGSESLREQRNPEGNLTILSGELGSPFSVLDNSLHVVTARFVNGTAVLSGFVITRGHANAASPDDAGGGMLIDTASPTVQDCVFVENTANNGGAMAITVGSTPGIYHCTFHNNSAFFAGGAMYVTVGSGPIISRCTFFGNLAGSAGGAVFASMSGLNLADSVLSGNVAQSGGGVQSFQSTATLTNCTLWGNQAGSGAGGFVNNSGSATIRSSILWNNSLGAAVDQAAQLGGLAPVIDYSCVHGWLGDLGGTGNIGSNPLFLDADGPDNTNGTADDDHRLKVGSPARNTGDPAMVPAAGKHDLDGHARVLCNRVDMGAYESGLGDADCDGVVNLNDFQNWGACMTGPGGSPIAGGCEAFDADGDNDIDLDDFHAFQSFFLLN